MTKTEVEALLEEFDEALVQEFPGPEPMSVLLVGGACFLLQGITTQSTDSVDVIIVEMVGSKERTLVFHSPTADKIRRIIRAIGKRHGLKGERQQFLNDAAAPFLLEPSRARASTDAPAECLPQAVSLRPEGPRLSPGLQAHARQTRERWRRYCRPAPGACDPEPGTGAADCGPVLSFPCSAGHISVALHIGARVREVTESSRIRVVRSCLLCYAVRGTGLL